MTNFINTDPVLLLFGCLYTIVGASIIVSPKQWAEFTMIYRQSDAVHLISGVFILPIALWILIFVNSETSLSLTVLKAIGYFGLIEAILLLVRPGFTKKLVTNGKFVLKPFWLCGVLSMIIGLTLLINFDTFLFH